MHNALRKSEPEELEQDSSEDVVFECTPEQSAVSPVEAIELPLTAKISSLLFVSSRPLSVRALSVAARASEERVERALSELQAQYSETMNGFSLQEIGGAWEFRTSPSAKNAINRLITPKSRRLSRAAAETLAVIAYRQPVQRAEIEAVRGVDALPTLKTLLDARLIRVVGRESTPGHPALYGTTQTFLEKFGLNDLSELPTARELEQMLDEPGEASEPAEESNEEGESNDEQSDSEGELAA